MNNCNTCNKLCNKFIPSDSISVVTIDGVDTLLIDVPSGVYANGERYCIVTLQSIPATATVNMPVAISIGGVTDVVYPLVCYKTCLQAVASQISPRTRYCTVVQTNTTGGVFKSYSGLKSSSVPVLASIPAGGV